MVLKEPVTVQAITFEMEGNISKDILENIKLKINGEDIENAEYLWVDEKSLLVDMSAKNYELKDDVLIDITGDIKGGEKGQMFAFHFVGINAVGKESGLKIESVGVNGSKTPMPQIHSLK
ncbi:hypothetical protein JW911_05305 [Candidatus Peregrinibacteria bacterium]|nr:hypothetical protein [Candidatus Peregrinibacteria bacterium]